MGSSFAQNLAFDEPTGYEVSSRAFSPAAASGFDEALHTLAPNLIAMGGLVLFGCALVVAFRIIALDAVRQLQEPAIDFAICGAVAFLGLAISWVHFGDNPRVKAEDANTGGTELAVEPARSAPAVPTSRNHRRSLPWTGDHACPFCSQEMTSLGAALYLCRTCRHFAKNGPVSFLDSGSSCNCHHCRQNLEYAG